jgi:hypothetical protein
VTTSIEHSPSALAERAPLRLRVDGSLGRSRTRRTGASAVDGVWWPQSRDIGVEVADLVDHLPADLGAVNRIVFSRADWDTTPHRVAVGRGWLKAGSYPGQDGQHRLMLSMASDQLIRLRVVAPSDGPASDDWDSEEDDVLETWHDAGDSFWGADSSDAPSDRLH